MQNCKLIEIIQLMHVAARGKSGGMVLQRHRNKCKEVLTEPHSFTM